MDELRSLFSPYELAVGGVLIQFVLFATAVLLVATGRPAAIFLLAPLMLAARLVVGEISRCPGCGKRPTKSYLLNHETGIGRLFFRERAWPERECSSCRTRLDGI
jgi:hypothetical protein